MSPGEKAMMNRYIPLFSQIVDSSLWCEDDGVCKVFMTLLAKQDADHVVRGSAFAIGRWANKSEPDVLKALEILSSPDKTRVEPQAHDGRRIERVADGWLILNGAKYQEMMQDANRRARNAARMRTYRGALKGNSTPLAGEATYLKTGVDVNEKGLR